MSSDRLRELADEAPIVRVVNLIIAQAVNDNATEIIIEPDDNKLIVFYRVEEALHEVMTPPMHIRDAITARLKIMADLDYSNSVTPQNGIIHFRHEDKPCTIELSITPTQFGEKLEMKIKTG
jgi:type II secretory ATPase GspE/PulE/Tfp pilus assembly ATPase PilB-like protein